jgi:EAL domain-containing protein (putative c-di-GMP-specific phosphodiesterase class I)
LHELGLQVVAEEVENEQQRIILADRGCHMIQDYWISKPLSSEQFLAWLVGQTRNR